MESGRLANPVTAKKQSRRPTGMRFKPVGQTSEGHRIDNPLANLASLRVAMPSCRHRVQSRTGISKGQAEVLGIRFVTRGRV